MSDAKFSSTETKQVKFKLSFENTGKCYGHTQESKLENAILAVS